MADRITFASTMRLLLEYCKYKILLGAFIISGLQLAFLFWKLKMSMMYSSKACMKGEYITMVSVWECGAEPWLVREKGLDGCRSGAKEPLSMLTSLSRAGRCRRLLTWQPLLAVWQGAMVLAEVKRCDVDSRTASVLCSRENPAHAAHVPWERGQWPF